ncbi:MAG: proprotein convertase P-domain-containing protein [bacterium]|nr:proprotein convertase P-domain-containing protein [bacterium]MDT8367010.1 proprotein convertase P-domain-containing protein [bacterium]
MKRWVILLVLILPLLLVACGGSGGSGPPPVFTYYSSDTPQMIPDEDFIRSDILVTGGPSYISQVEVTVAIFHPSVSDLVLVLESPTSGSWIYLTQNDSAGEHFWYTTFTEDALTWIRNTNSSDDPRTGYYLPAERLDWFIGENANGVWTLDVEDNVAQDEGCLIEWSIDIQ